MIRETTIIFLYMATTVAHLKSGTTLTGSLAFFACYNLCVQVKSPRIRTLLYGDQRLNPGEIDLLHTPALQRLYDLHQLGLTDRIYVDASHSRLHHVVGVLEQADKIVDAIVDNLEDKPDRKLVIAGGPVAAGEFAKEVGRWKPVIRLIGLLHDLSHAPYGHTIEDEIGLVACKHDEPDRQSEVFYRLVCQYVGWLALESGVRPSDAGEGGGGLEMPRDLWSYLMSPESPPSTAWSSVARMGGVLLKRVGSTSFSSWHRSDDGRALAAFLAQLACAMRALLYLDVLHADEVNSKNTPYKRRYPFERLIAKVLQIAGMGDCLHDWQFVPTRDAYVLDVIGNTVCADLLDYAQRDAHFAGMKLGYDADRIAENFTLVSWEPKKKDRKVEIGVADPFAGKSLRTAISLYSHKLRTDVAGELMNLLNVRFYLYERALFHPTKCAAGAMLGSALQLIGWRPLRKDSSGKDERVDAYELPSQFRHIGDAVFLHDVLSAVRIALTALDSNGGATVSSIEAKRSLGSLECSQLLVARLILDRWDGCDRGEAVESIRAGLELLRRVMARRFYKAVFRNLPNSRDETLDKGPEDLADTFKDPIIRFEAERSIEKKAGLRRGSVVIHCPRFITAKKVANVLLVFPKPDGKGESPRKLREIGELEPAVFEAHQEAILAVEKMYESMWRLVVYVTPDALAQYPRVSDSAGKVIFETMDKYRSYPDGTESWKGDSYLERELKQKFGAFALGTDERSTKREVSPVPEPRVVDAPGWVKAGADSEQGIGPHPARQQMFVAVMRRAWRSNLGGDMPKLVEFYESDLQRLPDDEFEGLIARFDVQYKGIARNRRPKAIEEVFGDLRALRDGGGPLFTAR